MASNTQMIACPYCQANSDTRARWGSRMCCAVYFNTVTTDWCYCCLQCCNFDLGKRGILTACGRLADTRFVYSSAINHPLPLLPGKGLPGRALQTELRGSDCGLRSAFNVAKSAKMCCATWCSSRSSHVRGTVTRAKITAALLPMPCLRSSAL